MTVQPKRSTVGYGTRRGSRTVMPSHAELADLADLADLAGRTPVASFARYTDAEHTLDLLARTSFPVHRVTLVGGDLKLVGGADTGLTAIRTATLGGCGGLWVGAMMALFSVVNGPAGGLLIRLSWGLPLGALSGVAVGLSAYAILGEARGSTRNSRLVPTRHELHVDVEIAASAWRLLHKLHPAGMMPVDRVPAEVVAQPTELVLIETFEGVDGQAPPAGRPDPAAGRDAPASGPGAPASGRDAPASGRNAPASGPGARPVDLPAGAS